MEKQIIIVTVPVGNMPPKRAQDWMKSIAVVVRESIEEARNTDKIPLLVVAEGTTIESLYVNFPDATNALADPGAPEPGEFERIMEFKCDDQSCPNCGFSGYSYEKITDSEDIMSCDEKDDIDPESSDTKPLARSDKQSQDVLNLCSNAIHCGNCNDMGCYHCSPGSSW